MIQEYLQLLPEETVGTAALVITIIGVIVGAALWLVGTKISRPLITLLTVLLGAGVGMHLPAWCKWDVSGAGPAVGGAVVLGVSGYVLHRMWVGIGLGTVLAGWAAFVVWMFMRDGHDWDWPQFESSMSVVGYLKIVWSNVPANMARVMPFACGCALVTGVAAAILWPKLTTVLHWSSAGVTLLAGTGIAAMAFARPEWLKHLPQQTWMQSATLATMVALGAAIQWNLAPKAAKASAAKGKPQKNADEET